MKWSRFVTSLEMNFKMLVRRKVVLLLLSVIPVLFISMVHFTSAAREVAFKIGIDASTMMVKAQEVDVGLIFVTMATTGFLASFLSLNITQQYQAANQRLIVCGYRPSELIFSNLTLMVIMILILVACTAFAISIFFQPQHPGYLIMGLLFTGITYGSYGIMAGSLVKGELEGTLSVVLLANIDAGWLQNPLFFSEARNKLIIQSLPAYYPSQISLAAAFSDLSIQKPIVISLIYAASFLFLALIIMYCQMRIKKHVHVY